MNPVIRIKLKSYDHSLVDKSAEKIVKTVKSIGAVIRRPHPPATHKRIFTVNRSTFVNKKSATIRAQLLQTPHNIYNAAKIVEP